MPQKFSAISKGDLKKFDGKKARIVTRASWIEATGEIYSFDGMVIFLSDKTELEKDLNRADWIREPYNDGFDIYYRDEPDDFVSNADIKEIEIL